uniref:Uncharacterized protein n=1 Tax=Cafeteria roenbergensis TaxID=33653 RepID=A0A7S0K656_CAFRO
MGGPGSGVADSADFGVAFQRGAGSGRSAASGVGLTVAPDDAALREPDEDEFDEFGGSQRGARPGMPQGAMNGDVGEGRGARPDAWSGGGGELQVGRAAASGWGSGRVLASSASSSSSAAEAGRLKAGVSALLAENSRLLELLKLESAARMSAEARATLAVSPPQRGRRPALADSDAGGEDHDEWTARLLATVHADDLIEQVLGPASGEA